MKTAATILAIICFWYVVRDAKNMQFNALAVFGLITAGVVLFYEIRKAINAPKSPPR